MQFQEENFKLFQFPLKDHTQCWDIGNLLLTAHIVTAPSHQPWHLQHFNKSFQLNITSHSTLFTCLVDTVSHEDHLEVSSLLRVYVVL